jgi:RNA polymerase sigma-70 factor (ECF subfamily)
MQVWKALPNFAQKSEIDTWAYRIAINTSLAWNPSTTTRRENLPTESTELSQLAGQTGSSPATPKILDEFLQSLSKVDRAVMLVHLDGLADVQASAVTGLSAGAFRVRLHRLKKKFQALYCETEAEA